MKRALALAVTAATLTLVAGCGNDTSAPPRALETPSAAAGGSTSTSSGSSTGDPAAEQQSATWLTGQLTKGLVHNDQYQMDDYGLSADVALALAQVPGHEADVHRIAEAVNRSAKSYVAPGYGTQLSAGATAKTIVLDQAAGVDPGSLVGQLQGLVASDGRVADKLDPTDKKAMDYANVVAQAYAVRALDKAGSPQAGPATAYLLQQQCSDGWFRLSFTADAKAKQQGCDADPKAAPDVDTTALAVLALSQASDQPGADAAVTKAVSWLTSTQAADGSFASGSPATPNANSTGLAGWAMGTAGETDPAGKAASWVADHQLGCGTKDAGAIAYDDAGARAKSVTIKTQDQFRRATAQALPVLQWLPDDSASASC